MTDVNFTITIPDPQMPRVTAAMHTHYGQVEDGTDPETGEPVFRDLTGAEIVQRLSLIHISEPTRPY